MIESLVGQIEHLTPAELHLKTSLGVTFHLFISVPTSRILREKKEMGLPATAFVHTQILKNDPFIKLFGFASRSERSTFRELLTVNGVGPAAAIKIVSARDPEFIISAIVNKDIDFFSGIKGIGKKTAGRIVFDLQDRFANSDASAVMVSGVNPIKAEAIEALQVLGYTVKESEQAVKRAYEVVENKYETSDTLVAVALASM